MNDTKKRNSRVITIDIELHDKMREYCDAHGMKLHFFASEAIKRHLDRVKTQQDSGNG